MLSEKLKQIDEDKQVSDLLAMELEEKLGNVQKDVEHRDIQIADLLKKINEIEVIRHKTTNQQYSLTSSKAVTEIVMRCLMKDPNLDFKPANKIIYNANDHHGNNFVTQVHKAISKKCDLTRFIKAVQSTSNQPHYRNSIILKKDFKNNNNELAQYIAMIVLGHDAGYALNVILTASTQWEAVAQAKLIRLHVKSIGNMPIIEKFNPA